MVEPIFAGGAPSSLVTPASGTNLAECPLTPRWKLFSKRVMQLGFFAFLLKGIVWLVVGFLAWKGVS